MQHTGTSGFPAGMSRMTPTVPRTVMRHHDNKDMEIIPGGSGWSQTIPTTSNLSRAELTNGTVLEINETGTALKYAPGVLQGVLDPMAAPCTWSAALGSALNGQASGSGRRAA